MSSAFDGVVDRFLLASGQFGQKLAEVQLDQWILPTPCTKWDIRQLASHMAGGNLSYIRLLSGASSAEFLRARGADTLGTDPVSAYVRSVRACAEAFTQPGALIRVLDYPLGRVTGQQALAVRTTDTVIHTWDLARAIGTDDTLDAGLVTWISESLDEIYAGLAETPTATETTHQFFAAPGGILPHDASQQDRLLHRMGRQPEHSIGGIPPAGYEAAYCAQAHPQPEAGRGRPAPATAGDLLASLSPVSAWPRALPGTHRPDSRS